jgi:aspartate/methionine/tyrosine aminotransferase
MVAADAQVISEILKVKSQMDSGMFKPLQLAAVQALAQGPEWFAELNEEYRRRRVLAGEIFDLLGVEYDHDSTGMFLWGRVGDFSTPLRSGRNDREGCFAPVEMTEKVASLRLK